MSSAKRSARRPRRTIGGRITVLAGVNGAGKSSILGAVLRDAGANYFNPDEHARQLRVANPGLGTEAANAEAWSAGHRGLQQAIALGEDFAFETTLGGNSIPALLQTACDRGLEVVVGYVGLDSSERHISRVRARVARGGHDIPEEKIRERYRRSREHLIALMPSLTELRVYDNSAEGDPERGVAPAPVLLLETVRGTITHVAERAAIPAWARPIVAAALGAELR